jgi:hypothetical protein
MRAPKRPARDVDSLDLEGSAEGLIERIRLLGPRSVREVRAVSLVRVLQASDVNCVSFRNARNRVTTRRVGVVVRGVK